MFSFKLTLQIIFDGITRMYNIYYFYLYDKIQKLPSILYKIKINVINAYSKGV